jgi:hypothetical protein
VPVSRGSERARLLLWRSHRPGGPETALSFRAGRVGGDVSVVRVVRRTVLLTGEVRDRSSWFHPAEPAVRRDARTADALFPSLPAGRWAAGALELGEVGPVAPSVVEKRSARSGDHRGARGRGGSARHPHDRQRAARRRESDGRVALVPVGTVVSGRPPSRGGSTGSANRRTRSRSRPAGSLPKPTSFGCSAAPFSWWARSATAVRCSAGPDRRCGGTRWPPMRAPLPCRLAAGELVPGEVEPVARSAAKAQSALRAGVGRPRFERSSAAPFLL